MLARRLRTVSRSTLCLVAVAAVAPPIGATIGSTTDVASSLATMMQPAAPPAPAPQVTPAKTPSRAASGPAVVILGVDPVDDPYAATPGVAPLAPLMASPREAGRPRTPRRAADTVDPWDPSRTVDLGAIGAKALLDIDTSDPWAGAERSL